MVLLLHLVFKALLRVMLTVFSSCIGCSVFGLLSKRFSVAIVTWSLLIRKKSAVIPRAKVPHFGLSEKCNLWRISRVLIVVHFFAVSLPKRPSVMLGRASRTSQPFAALFILVVLLF